MARFIDIVKAIDWRDVEWHILDDERISKVGLSGLKRVFDWCRNQSPSDLDMDGLSIRVSKGCVDGIRHDSDVRLCLSTTDWLEWLQLPVILNGVDEAAAVAEILWEMTFFGFTNEKVQRKVSKMTEESGNFIQIKMN